jgi:hypothetical protein
MEKIKVKLIGENGNIFNLLAIASNEMKNNGLNEESDKMISEVFKSKSYDSALLIISRYVEII